MHCYYTGSWSWSTHMCADPTSYCSELKNKLSTIEYGFWKWWICILMLSVAKLWPYIYCKLCKICMSFHIRSNKLKCSVCLREIVSIELVWDIFHFRRWTYVNSLQSLASLYCFWMAWYKTDISANLAILFCGVRILHLLV